MQMRFAKDEYIVLSWKSEIKSLWSYNLQCLRLQEIVWVSCVYIWHVSMGRKPCLRKKLGQVHNASSLLIFRPSMPKIKKNKATKKINGDWGKKWQVSIFQMNPNLMPWSAIWETLKEQELWIFRLLIGRWVGSKYKWSKWPENEGKWSALFRVRVSLLTLLSSQSNFWFAVPSMASLPRPHGPAGCGQTETPQPEAFQIVIVTK